MKRYFCLILILAVIAGLSACSIKMEKIVDVTETSVINVTNEAGETVTDANGEIETEVVTVPVTEVVTDKSGETVTQKDGTPVTEAVKEAVTNAGKTDGKTTVNWREKYKTTAVASKDTTTVNSEADKADEEALQTPFNQSYSLNTSSSTYKPGAYTEALKKLISGNSYTMAVILDFKGLEGVEMKDATLVAYVDGNKKAYHYTADLSAFTSEVKEDDLKDVTEVSGMDLAALFKNMSNLKIHMIMKNGKFYMTFPQLNVYMEMAQNDVDSMLDEQIDTILIDGTFIESKTMDNGMVRESFKAEDGSIVHYYYQNAKFSRIDIESNGKTNTVLRVKSVTKGVSNKLVFAEPYAYQVKIDADSF